MNMDLVMFHSIWTLSLLVLFVGIWIWAWSGKRKRKRSFEAAARLPLDDDAPLGPSVTEKSAVRPAQKPKLSTQRKRTVRKNG